MKVWNAARMLAGACIIYGLVSACSGAADTRAFAGNTSGAGGGDSAAATTGSGGECNCPAPTPQPPDVAVEKCDKYLPDADTGNARYYAIHLYPDANVTDLYDVVAFGPPKGPYAPPHALQTATMSARPIFFQDGEVSVLCNDSSESVTFVRQAH